MVAIHNQALGAAYHRSDERTKSDLAEEANLVKVFLSRGVEPIQEDIKRFISVVDYAPVNNPANITAEQSISSGQRINHLNALCNVMIDVVDCFFRLYPIDAKISNEIVGELTSEMLNQKGWVAHYKNKHNSKDLSEKFMQGPFVKSQEGLQTYIMQYIKENSILLADIRSAQHSSDASKRDDSAEMDVDSVHTEERGQSSSEKSNYFRTMVTHRRTPSPTLIR